MTVLVKQELSSNLLNLRYIGLTLIKCIMFIFEASSIHPSKISSYLMNQNMKGMNKL